MGKGVSLKGFLGVFGQLSGYFRISPLQSLSLHSPGYRSVNRIPNRERTRMTSDGKCGSMGFGIWVSPGISFIYIFISQLVAGR